MLRTLLEQNLPDAGAGTVVRLTFNESFDEGVAIALRYLRTMRGDGLALSDKDYQCVLQASNHGQWEHDKRVVEVTIASTSIVAEFITRLHKGLESVEVRHYCCAEQ
jgi:hypothetical protein